MKRNMLKISQCFSIVVVSLLFILLDAAIFPKKSTEKIYTERYVLPDVPNRVRYNYGYKGDIDKTFYTEGKITRIRDEIREFILSSYEEVKCNIGDIIISTEDISSSIEKEDINGRILNIQKNIDSTSVYVDLSSNYIANFVIDDISINYVNKLVNADIDDLKLVNLKDNEEYQKDLLSFTYSKKNNAYNLSYLLLSLTNQTFVESKVSLSLLIKSYKNVNYTNIHSFSYIDFKGVGILDHIISVDPLIKENVTVKIIDYTSGYVIFEANNYKKEKFYYHYDIVIVNIS
ncbi:MAG: hypothetical protein SPJ52_01190 [Candidatus Enterosoma sp.]|nr:hypothetical protein [bacterium]MDY5865748.1 hypothetical protein [Candidatus Enterosoma sp.]